MTNLHRRVHKATFLKPNHKEIKWLPSKASDCKDKMISASGKSLLYVNSFKPCIKAKQFYHGKEVQLGRNLRWKKTVKGGEEHTLWEDPCFQTQYELFDFLSRKRLRLLDTTKLLHVYCLRNPRLEWDHGNSKLRPVKQNYHWLIRPLSKEIWSKLHN